MTGPPPLLSHCGRAAPVRAALQRVPRLGALPYGATSLLPEPGRGLRLPGGGARQARALVG